MNIFEPNTEGASSITQGCLVELHNSASAKYGIVVTGECDIAQRKFSNIFSYVELLPVSEFTWKYIIHPALESLAEEIADLFFDKLHAAPDFKDVDPSIIHALLLGDTPFPPVQDQTLAQFHQDAIAARHEIAQLKSNTSALPSARVQLENLYKLAKALQCRTRCHTIQSVYEKLRTDPGDQFYVGPLPQELEPHIASLRVLREIHKNHVVTKPSELSALPAGQKFAKPLCRLTAPYRYRLTQKLAAVFSDIGLPGEFETHRSATLKTMLSP